MEVDLIDETVAFNETDVVVQSGGRRPDHYPLRAVVKALPSSCVAKTYA